MKAIKTILQKIFPALLLKQAILVFNKAKILTRDKVYFPDMKSPVISFKFIAKGYAWTQR